MQLDRRQFTLAMMASVAAVQCRRHGRANSGPLIAGCSDFVTTEPLAGIGLPG